MKSYPYPFQSQPKDDQVVSYRVEVLSFFKEFGLTATKKAFKVSKTTIYRWQKTFSVSTIGKIIKRNHFFFQKQGRIYHNPASGWAKRKPAKRLRARYSPKPTEFGYLQMDTVFKIIEGVRSYFYSAIDVKLKFGLSLAYSRLNSQHTLDFFRKVELVYPLKIKSVQTDNGLEFLGIFDQYPQKNRIPHFFIYPRCPKINGVVGRYQRTIQEEFLEPNLDLIHNPKLFSDKLAEYLLFYNLTRPHHALGFKSPLNYLVEEGYQSQMCVTHTQA